MMGSSDKETGKGLLAVPTSEMQLHIGREDRGFKSFELFLGYLPHSMAYGFIAPLLLSSFSQCISLHSSSPMP